jgi:regulator of protease activity HflC (stomatin/prohibitin superfamily)
MLSLTTLLLLCLATLILSAVRRVPDGQVYSLYRRGKPARLLQPGLHVLVPLLERVVNKIDLGGQTLRFEAPRPDAGQLRGTVYWQVLEPERADVVFGQVDQLIRRGADEVLRDAAQLDTGNRRALGVQLKQTLNSTLRERGMLVTRVELDAA